MGVGASQLPAPIPRHGTQDTRSNTSQVAPTGLSPSMAPLSRGLRLPWGDGDRVLQPHIPSGFPHQVRFALCPFRSPLLRASHLLSFPPGTKMFQFPGFPFATANDAILSRQEVPFSDPGFKGYVHLARAYRSLSRPSSAPEPSHPPSGLACQFLLIPSSAGAGGWTYAWQSSCTKRAILPDTCKVKLCRLEVWWTCRDLNPRPSACKADALPLSYRPSESPTPPKLRRR